jgi:hypothetical protein
VLIAQLQPAGSRCMQADEFHRGHPLALGTRFLLPGE